MIKPIRDNILVKADETKTKTNSGLLLSEDWKTLPLTGKILEVGPDVSLVKKGDQITFMRYASIILENGERLCSERHVFGTIDG